MTEEAWLNSWKYWHIYSAIRHRSSVRQLRLFMAACCRLMSHEFFDARIQRALDAADRCADDPAAEAVAHTVGWETSTSPQPEIPHDGWEGKLAAGILGAQSLLDEFWEESPDGDRHLRRHWQKSLAHAVYMSLRRQPGVVFTGGTGDAAEYCMMHLNIADAMRQGYELDSESCYQWDYENLEKQNPEFPRRIADLLRDIFGNPFRPVAFDPSWRTSTVVALAEQMYGSRDFAPMPVLADALEDAGCDNEDILAHCRGDGPHVRGCWVVDLILGKS